MSVGTDSVSEHLAIRRPTGRIDPVIAKALDTLERKRLQQWAIDNNVNINNVDPANDADFNIHYKKFQQKLTETLTQYGGTLRTVTKDLRKKLASDVERLLYSNPTIYATALANAVAEWKEATKPPPAVDIAADIENRVRPIMEKVTTALNNLVHRLSQLPSPPEPPPADAASKGAKKGS